jgi:hypothetical protein
VRARASSQHEQLQDGFVAVAQRQFGPDIVIDRAAALQAVAQPDEHPVLVGPAAVVQCSRDERGDLGLGHFRLRPVGGNV